MTAPASGKRNHQKVCDVFDFFEPDFLDVVTNVLRVNPSLRRRSWEFANIFLALKQGGMLDGTKYGLGMGVGTERLIYGLEPFVKRALLTDLYQVDSGWVAVRTDDPNAMLRARAPWEINWSKMDAKRMDMRSLDLPNEEVDFAWSTGAIEHIGEDADFIKHFNEVARVLKPGGMYVFTTAVNFGEDTVRFPHNYLFGPQHLVNLIEQSNLQAAPVFDCSIREHSLNEPMFEDLTEFGLNIPRQMSPHLVSFRRGIVTTANCMVLTKREAGRAPTQVAGFDKTRASVRRSASALVRNIWSEPQQIRVDKKGQKARTPVMYFGSGPITVRAMGQADSLRVTSRSRGVDKTMTVEKTARFTTERAELTINASEERIYKIECWGADPDVHVWAQRPSAKDKASPSSQE